MARKIKLNMLLCIIDLFLAKRTLGRIRAYLQRSQRFLSAKSRETIAIGELVSRHQDRGRQQALDGVRQVPVDPTAFVGHVRGKMQVPPAVLTPPAAPRTSFRRKNRVGIFPPERVAGHSGLVGSALMRRLSHEKVTLLSARSSDLDLRRQTDTEAWIARHLPEVIFLAAAQ